MTSTLDGASPIVCIVGATATGKTAAAVDLCERIGGEIVGADSVQVYRHVDIGSGKPTAQALRGIPHHLIDVADPDEPIDAVRFAQLADAAIARVRSAGRVPVVVGGTGLWLRALLRGLVDVPAVDTTLRAALEQRWDREGAATMHAYLAQVDPASALRVHPNDKLRVVRALEVFEQTGAPMGELRRQHALGAPRYAALTYLLQLPRVHLLEQQRMRIEGMFAAGWVAETAGLLATYGPDIRALSAVGYRQIVEHLHGAASLETTVTEVQRATRLYARRQETWFKRDPDVSARITPDALNDASFIDAIARHVGR